MSAINLSESQTQGRRVLISVNPKAGRTSPFKRAEILCQELTKLGFEAELLTDLAEVAAKANEAYGRRELRAVVGVGGDGTAAELVNRTEPGVPVTLLAAGTANLLAKQFRLPTCPRGMAQVIASGTPLTLDAGLANGRLFLAMVSAGIDADIVRQVHAAREENYKTNAKKGAHISYLSYMNPIFKSLRHYRYPEIHVDVKDDARATSAELVGRWAFIFNLPRYGWGVSFTPACRGADGRLDFCVFRKGGVIRSVFNAACAQFGGVHRVLPTTRLGQGTDYALRADVPVPYQLDGDPAGYLPVSVKIIPGRFTTLVASAVAKKLQKK
ncbi:MAG: diacylglycerol kinase family protein [Planctomycetia bacterium]|nr:diacylglycerol kinase family protein [Planctomycetia bacterium]